MARLISETLEQEKHQLHQQHLEDTYEQSTEEVSPQAGHLGPCAPLHLTSYFIESPSLSIQEPKQFVAGRVVSINTGGGCGFDRSLADGDGAISWLKKLNVRNKPLLMFHLMEQFSMSK